MKGYIKGVWFLVFLAVIGCGGKEEEISYGSIRGRCTISGQDAGNSGLLIYVEGTSYVAYTQDSGEFLITQVSPGTYTLVCTKEGYTIAREEGVVVEGGRETSGIVLTLNPLPSNTGSISGRVTLEGAETGNSGIAVFLAGTSYVTYTDDRGNFLLKDVAPGSYTLIVFKDGYTSATVENVVVNAQQVTTVFPITLIPLQTGPSGELLGGISGRVTLNGAQTGNGGIAVFIAGTSYVAYTDDNGYYTLSNVPKGVYNVKAVKDGYYPSEVPNVTVTAGSITTGIDMDLQPVPLPSKGVGIVTGRITLNGSLTGNSGVVVFLEGTSFSAYTDNEGYFTINDVVPGTYNLTAYKVGYTVGRISNVVVTEDKAINIGVINLLPVSGGGNAPPYVTSNPVVSVYENELYLYQVIAEDPEGDPISFSLAGYPEGMTMSTDGLISWVPSYADVGNHTIVVQISDNQGNVSYHIYTLKVVSRWITFTRYDGLLSDEINNVMVDSLDRVWAVSYRGISVVDGGNITNYTPLNTGKEVNVDNVTSNEMGKIDEVIPAGTISDYDCVWDEWSWEYDCWIRDTSKNWITDEHVGKWVYYKNVWGGYYPAPITHNTSDTLWFYGWGGYILQQGDFYFGDGYYVYITLKDNDANWLNGELRGRMFLCYYGSYYDYYYDGWILILNNTSSEITVARWNPWWWWWEGRLSEFLNCVRNPHSFYKLSDYPLITVTDNSANWVPDSLTGSISGNFRVIANMANTLQLVPNTFYSPLPTVGSSFILNTGLGGNVRELAEDSSGKIYAVTDKGLSVFDGTNWSNLNMLNTAVRGVISNVFYGESGTIDNFIDAYTFEDTSKNFMPNELINHFILIGDGYYSIASNSTTTISLNIPRASGATLEFPAVGDTYYLSRNNTITIRDSSASWTTNAFVGKEVWINGNTYKIVSNTSNTITFKYPETSSLYGKRPIKPGDRYFILTVLPEENLNDIEYYNGILYIATSQNGILYTNTSLSAVQSFRVENTSIEITGDVEGCDYDWYYSYIYIIDRDANWAVDEHKGKTFESNGRWGIIEGNTNDTLYVRNLYWCPAYGSSYHIYSNGLRWNGIRDIEVDKNGNLWVTYSSDCYPALGLTFFNGFSWTTYTYENSGLKSNCIRRIYPTSNRSVWIGYGSGATVFDGFNWTTYTVENTESSLGKADGLGSNDVTGFAEDVDGEIWITTYGGGVSKFDGSHWKNYIPYYDTGAYKRGNSGLLSKDVKDADVDSQGNKWFGTSLGLTKFVGD